MTPDAPKHGSKEALFAEVYDWLLGEGYPLELRVARALGRHGWEFVLGARYRDSIKHDSVREIDILATRRSWLLKRRDLDACAEVKLAIECKSSKKNKPWVVFAIDELDDDTAMNMSDDVPLDYDLIPVGDLARDALGVSPIFKEPGFERLYVWMRRPATSVVEALRSREGTDNSYSAVMSALGAARSFAAATPDKDQLPRFQYCVPVVVVDAPVFRFSVNADGSDRLQEVGVAAVLAEHTGLANASATQASHAVHIVSYEALDDFLDGITRDADALIDSLVSSRAAYTKLQRYLNRRPRRG